MPDELTTSTKAVVGGAEGPTAREVAVAEPASGSAAVAAPTLNLSRQVSAKWLASDTTFVKPGRIAALDLFRGMTIAAMILVNNAGGPSYGPLDHAEWNGWTHTDLIFPFFMFIAGASMALSFSSRKAFTTENTKNPKVNQNKTQGPSRRSGAQDDGGEGKWRRALMLHTVRRGAIIFFIGLWLNLFPWFFDANRYANLRIPGVLQRIGFCYIFAGIIYLWTSPQVPTRSSQERSRGDKEAGPHTKRYIRAGIVAALLLGYWAAMKLVPVPGFGAGDLAPTHNLAAYIDNAIFTTRHLWQHRAWDPEGLLSSVPALCTILLGTFVGEMFTDSSQLVVSSQESQKPEQLQHQTQGPSRKHAQDDSSAMAGASAMVDASLQSTWQYKVKQLLAWGTAAIIVGEVWGIWFPMNKNLWTSSYVIFTAGYAMVLLAACYWLVDVKGWRRWGTPFLVFGSNAILAFTLSTWVTKILLITRVPNGTGGSMSAWSWLILNTWRPHFSDVRNSSLAFALSYVLIWLAIMWWFYKKRIFVKI